MWSHAKRFAADLRKVGGWVAALALAAVVVSVLTTYMAVFSVTERRSGTLSTAPPRELLGFLRVIDPGESIVTGADSIVDLEGSVLDEPGPRVLLDRMGEDDRMFIVLPLSAFTYHVGSGGPEGPDARAVVGAGPPFLGAAPEPGEALLWGSITDSYEGVEGVSDTAIKGLRLRQVSEEPLTAEYVAGNGRRVGTEDTATVAFDVSAARELGIIMNEVSEVVGGFTCYCDTSDLADLAAAMTEAESRAGTGRVYYAVGYEGLIGPVGRSRALGGALNTGYALGTLLSVWCLVVMAAQVFWARRSPVYLIDRLCGSGETPIQVRGQLLIALSLTLPALAGFEVVNVAIGNASWPPPLPPEARTLAVAGAATLHALAGVVTAVRTHRLCRFSPEEVPGG